MSMLSVLGLAAAMFLLAVTPGPGVFATVARALSSGVAHASVVIVGIVTGDLIFLLLAVFGLSAVADLLGGLFYFVKYVGGAYLIWLGLRIWFSKPVKQGLTGKCEPSWLENFAGGLLITIGNPKVILFYLGFLPTFVDLHSLSSTDIWLIATVVSGVLAAVLSAYALAAGRARKLFTSELAVRRMNRTAGGVMVTTGVVLVTRA